MKNEYKIADNDIIIFCKSRRDKCIYEVIIDKKDLKKVNKINYSIVYNRTHFGKYYPIVTLYLGIIDGKPKYKAMLLHKFLLNMTKEIVDHIDGNTKNNRRNNLRIGNQSNNCKNRKSKNSNNTSGYRNVTWMKGYWRVQLQIDGRNYMFPEKFKNVHKAGKFAKEMREKYYGEYAGLN